MHIETIDSSEVMNSIHFIFFSSSSLLSSSKPKSHSSAKPLLLALNLDMCKVNEFMGNQEGFRVRSRDRIVEVETRWIKGELKLWKVDRN